MSTTWVESALDKQESRDQQWAKRMHTHTGFLEAARMNCGGRWPGTLECSVGAQWPWEAVCLWLSVCHEEGAGDA